MRSLPTIESKWRSGGPYIGDKKPTTRVTVQEPWPDLTNRDFLRATSSSTGTFTKVPARWYQKIDNSQPEREIPNLNSVSIDRSIEQDAGTIQLSLNNQWLYANGAAPNQNILGQPGYFTHNRGESIDAAARWGHTANEWANTLAPNAVLRVYTGFGGDIGTIPTEVAAGNLALYGIFLLDEVVISTDGIINMTGRDMAKLLIEQQLFPPLVPETHYPLAYYRWETENVPVNMAPKQVFTQTDPAAGSPATFGIRRTVYRDSSADRWYGSNAAIHGHRATHSVDGNQSTYALSVGNGSPSDSWATDWWEYDCAETMNAVHVHPWAGGYTMYVSVMEGGTWQGTQVVPYDYAALAAKQFPATDTGANIPYVASFTIPHETARDFVLPRTYNADRVRVSFRGHAYSGLGTYKYRVGIREFRNMSTSVTTASFGTTKTEGKTVIVEPYTQAGGARFVPGKSYSQGYLTVSRFEQQDAFGDARILPVTREGPNISDTSVLSTPTAVRWNREGDGYYVLNSGGVINTYGNATFIGDPYGAGIHGDENGFWWDMAITHTGNGYWVLNSNGKVYSWGDAIDVSLNPIPVTETRKCSSIESHPSSMGFWVVRNDGSVYSRGAVSNHGGWPQSGQEMLVHRVSPDVPLGGFINADEGVQCIRSTSTGNGYWLLTTMGRVKAYGDAINHGQPDVLEEHKNSLFTESYWELFPTADDKGYILLHASGKVSPHGDVEMFGGPVPGGTAILRSDGNYTDYVHIVKELLLWAGFLLYDPTYPSNQPAPVYGALESTGSFAKDRLPDEIFDKRPVIDAITALREPLGYIAYVDSEGRFKFSSPNWWHIGNFDETGAHTNILHEIDEKVNVTQFTSSTSDESVRSFITITSHDPYADYSSTITTKYVPPSAERLRGLIKPAMWVNDFFMDPEEQQIMAELIGLHIVFQERVGQVTCLASPHVEIDDQVRIYERQTETTHVHYVRGVSFNHDLNSGEYLMTLTTHWLGPGTGSGAIVGGDDYPVSDLLQARMDLQQFGKLTKDSGGRTL